MKYLNLLTQTLHSVPYIASDPTARATWLNVILWSCEQENGGVLVGALHWKNRQWQQTCGVSLREINAAGNLLTWKGDDLHVWEYPADKQVEVASKRDGGRTGGQSKTQAKTQAAKENGARGGRPKTQAETQAETQASVENNPSYNPTEGKGREEEGKGSSPCPASASPSSDGERFVTWFLELLAETGAPPPKLTPSIRANWAGCYEKLVRIDGRTKDQVKEVCAWARNNDFWRGNFLSPMKLREKKDGVMWFDMFLAKMGAGNSHAPSVARPDIYVEPAGWRERANILWPDTSLPGTWAELSSTVRNALISKR